MPAGIREFIGGAVVVSIIIFAALFAVRRLLGEEHSGKPSASAGARMPQMTMPLVLLVLAENYFRRLVARLNASIR